MSNLPYWFTSEDRTNPAFCRACKQHIPRAAYMAGQGLCQNCQSRMASRNAVSSMPTVSSIPSKGPVSRSSVSPVPSSTLEPFHGDSTPAKAPAKRLNSAAMTSILIVLAGVVIAVVRLTMHF